ncbi:MAG: GNAT family N-acetyltransferase [Rubrivivax sp.]|nr:GNAT family N-acetyltransferase [Pyrinomonadaceae bacterium]
MLDEVTRMCMATVLETIPEFEGDARRVFEVLPNFTFEQMRAMLEGDCRNDLHRIMAAVDEEGHVRGYSAYSLKRDSEEKLYGYLFSRGIDPKYRRQGIAARLLEGEEAWFRSEGAEYIQAETHVTNVALRTLLEKHGFSLSGPVKGHWPYYILRKELFCPGTTPK